MIKSSVLIGSNLFLFLSIVFYAHGDSGQSSSVTVQTPFGLIKGRTKTILNKAGQERRVHTFQGIRYGNARRFERPKMVSKWTGVYNAHHPRFDCPQIGYTYEPEFIFRSDRNQHVSSEDCLFLNIFRPADNVTGRAVIVWLHGGGYKTGTGNFEGLYLASFGDIVLVTINYRLGVLGFSRFAEDPSKQGNAGLYDQLLALEWVSKTIIHFGGDVNRIVPMGESAGAMSLGALILAGAKHFSRAIMQSGSVNAPNRFNSPAQAENKTSLCAKALGCFKAQELVHCLSNKSVDELVDTCNAFSFVPTFGTELLPYHPVEHLQRKSLPEKKIDLLFGVSSNEGITLQMKHLERWRKRKLLNFAKVKEVIQGWTTFEGRIQDINTNKIVNFYMRGLNTTSSYFQLRNAIADAYGHFFIVCPLLYFAESFHTRAHKLGSMYAYHFMQSLDRPGCTQEMGVCHSTINFYTFGQPLKNQTYRGARFSTDDVELSLNIIKTNAAFARTGQPGPIAGHNWTLAFDDQSDINKLNYFRLRPDIYGMDKGLFYKPCQLWKDAIFIY